MSIRGEYWINDGHVDFADGDVGDLNHEAIAIEHVAHRYLDDLINLADDLEIDVRAFDRYSEYATESVQKLLSLIEEALMERADPNNPQKTMSEVQAEQMIMQHLGIDVEGMKILRGYGDGRLYVMKYEGWVAVRGNNIEFYGMDGSKLRGVVNGLDEIMSQEDIDDEETEFGLYDHKTGRGVDQTLAELRSGNLFRPQTLPQTKTNYIVPTTGERQYGRELWRGTSEGFEAWLESSLRDQLKVPQSPKHHPEGMVSRHTMMVRSSLKPAIDLLQKKQLEDPAGPLSELDLNFNDEDMNILRLAGLLHDIGKGDALNPETLSAHGHEDPATFEKAMRRLGPSWQRIYEKASGADKDDLWWVIKYHMSLRDDLGFQNKGLQKELMTSEGKYKSDRRVKLLLVLLLMDRMGRGGSSDFSWADARKFAKGNIAAAELGLGGIYKSSDVYRSKMGKKSSEALGDDPKMVVRQLRDKGRSEEQIRLALRGKFKMSDDEAAGYMEHGMSFREFLESTSEPAKMRAKIDLGEFKVGATFLSNLFKDKGHTFYVVGGTVRDYLMNWYHKVPYRIKDVDFATDAVPDEVKQILDEAGVRYIAKGESFGVISAIIDNQEFEIATFREESGYEDRRRPSNVKASDAANDYRRRDFTFNALYYDIPREAGGEGTIIDFGGGKGFEDIRSKRVTTVGSAHERFAEDPLRVLRGVRFHGIFNLEHMKDVLDPETFSAMKQFSSLEGVSPERIQAEFVAALTKARDPRVVLRGFEDIGALPYMFPNLALDMDAVEHLHKLPDSSDSSGKLKKVILTLAVLLRKSGSPLEIRQKLNKLNWPNEIADEVALLVGIWSSTKNPDPNELSQQANNLFKKNVELRRRMLQDFGALVGHEVDAKHLHHLSTYEPKKYSGEEIQRQLGLQKMGPEIGKKVKELQADDYRSSFEQKFGK